MTTHNRRGFNIQVEDYSVKKMALWFSTRRPSADEHEYINSKGYWLPAFSIGCGMAYAYLYEQYQGSENEIQGHLNNLALFTIQHIRCEDMMQLNAIFGEFSLELLMAFATQPWGTGMHPWKTPYIFQMRPCFRKMNLKRVKREMR